MADDVWKNEWLIHLYFHSTNLDLSPDLIIMQFIKNHVTLSVCRHLNHIQRNNISTSLKRAWNRSRLRKLQKVSEILFICVCMDRFHKILFGTAVLNKGEFSRYLSFKLICHYWKGMSAGFSMQNFYEGIRKKKYKKAYESENNLYIWLYM